MFLGPSSTPGCSRKALDAELAGLGLDYKPGGAPRDARSRRGPLRGRAAPGPARKGQVRTPGPWSSLPRHRARVAARPARRRRARARTGDLREAGPRRGEDPRHPRRRGPLPRGGRSRRHRRHHRRGGGAFAPRSGTCHCLAAGPGRGDGRDAARHAAPASARHPRTAAGSPDRARPRRLGDRHADGRGDPRERSRELRSAARDDRRVGRPRGGRRARRPAAQRAARGARSRRGRGRRPGGAASRRTWTTWCRSTSTT